MKFVSINRDTTENDRRTDPCSEPGCYLGLREIPVCGTEYNTETVLVRRGARGDEGWVGNYE